MVLLSGADIRPERRARRATERRGGLRPHAAEDGRRQLQVISIDETKDMSGFD